MISGKVIGLIMAAVLLTLVGGIIEQAGMSGDDMSHLQILMTAPRIAESTNFLGQISAMVDFGKTWVVALWDMLWWNYAFFEGSYAIVKYILWIPISVGIVLGLVQMFTGRTLIG